MAKYTYGLDLGSYEIKVYDESNDTIWKEKNVIALKNKREVFAVGNRAYEMFEKTPDSIQISFPMTGGVISRFNDMQFLLQNFLRNNGKRQLNRGSAYVIAVPTDVTEVEKKAFFDLVIHSAARAKEVNIVERAIADAVGMDIDVQTTKGIFVANFGAETTELSVLAEGGMIFNRLLKIGGRQFDDAIVELVRMNHDFLIGKQTAESLRKRFGVYTGESENTSVTVAGRDLITGMPMRKQIALGLVRAALRDPLLDCVRVIMSMIDRTPPEVRKAIYQNGIFLTGGIANTTGLSTYIEKATGIPTRVAVEPENCAVIGIKKIIKSTDLSKLAYSMLNDNYRWMR